MALNKQVLELLRDPHFTDDEKVWALQNSTQFPPYSETRARQLVWGARNETLYEKWFRNPARVGITELINWGPLSLVTGPLDVIRHLQGKPLVGTRGPGGSELSKKIAKKIVPPDLNAAVQILALILTRGRGGRTGQFGAALGGGMVGGYLQGETKGESFREAAPGALMAGAVEPGAPIPSPVERTQIYKRALSNQAARDMGQASTKLYRRLMTDNPDLERPNSLQDLIDFFSPTGKARVRAGAALQKLRQQLSSQPAFARIKVEVPVKVFDPVTQTYKITDEWLPMAQAIDYQTQLYGKGYGISGQPRGGIVAEPDRQLAAITKQRILSELRNPKNFQGAANWHIGYDAANQYEDYSTDYGLTATMGDIYKPDVITPARLIDHNKIYLNAANPKQSVHLNSLVGQNETNQFIADIAPGKQRIQFPEPGQVHFMGARIPYGRKPLNVPPDFRPLPSTRIPFRGPISAQAVNAYIQGGDTED